MSKVSSGNVTCFRIVHLSVLETYGMNTFSRYKDLLNLNTNRKYRCFVLLKYIYLSFSDFLFVWIFHAFRSLPGFSLKFLGSQMTKKWKMVFLWVVLYFPILQANEKCIIISQRISLHIKNFNRSVTNINHVQTDHDRSGKTKIADTSWFQMISFEFSWICCNRGLTEENNQLGIISLIGNFKSPIGISNPQLIIFNPVGDWWFVLWLCVTRLIHPQSPIGYIIPNHRFVISNWW